MDDAEALKQHDKRRRVSALKASEACFGWLAVKYKGEFTEHETRVYDDVSRFQWVKEDGAVYTITAELKQHPDILHVSAEATYDAQIARLDAVRANARIIGQPWRVIEETYKSASRIKFY